MNKERIATTENSKDIKGTLEIFYRAFTNPEALEAWLAPGKMTGKMHNFDLKARRGYEMSLYYPQADKESRGKTSKKEDRFTARFVELTPYKKIVQAIIFDSTDPAFTGEMTMEVTFEPKGPDTGVTICVRTFRRAYGRKTMKPAQSPHLRNWLIM